MDNHKEILQKSKEKKCKSFPEYGKLKHKITNWQRQKQITEKRLEDNYE